jgi:hypothetical protein
MGIRSLFGQRGCGERLGWQAERELEQMVTDAGCWQQQNPDGYPDAPIPDAIGAHAPSGRGWTRIRGRPAG